MKDVTAAIIEKDGKILIARRAPGQKQAGKWEFPGGKIEPGETAPVCLMRELKEELGIATEIGNKMGESIYHYEHGAIRLIAFKAVWLSGQIRLSVHDEYAWVKPDELLTYDLAPADIPIIRELCKNAE
jgi:8-oxo-dGTP diphosphatase